MRFECFGGENEKERDERGLGWDFENLLAIVIMWSFSCGHGRGRGRACHRCGDRGTAADTGAGRDASAGSLICATAALAAW